MKISQINFTKIFLILTTISIYTPKFGALDRMSIQYLLLSLTVFFSLVSIPFIFKELNLKKLFYNPFIICFSGYLIFALLSMTKSINVIESLVKINQLITFLLLLLIIVFLTSRNLIKVNHVLYILLFTLIIDLFFSLKSYLELVSNGVIFGYEYNYRIVGLHGNRNILATVLAFRIPLIILLASRVKDIRFSFFIFIISTISFFNIFLLSSRAAYLAIVMCIVFITVYPLIRNYKSLFKGSRKYYLSLLYILPCIIAYFISNQLIDANDQGNVASRVATIASLDDESKNTRLRYYSQSISHIKENPFLGAGIGNWKIVSIKYDKDYISNYIIPYNAHNDVLEATAETGIFGGLFFGTFFIFIFIYLIRHFKSDYLRSENYYVPILMSLSFLVFFVDLNLNFPFSRPVNLFLLLMYLSLLINFNSFIDEKK